jgi:hypothetical protein
MAVVKRQHAQGQCMKHSTGKPTKTEQDRLDAIHAMPCFACEIESRLSIASYAQPSKTEAHHLVDKGYRKHSGGHMATIPLCGWHHRGDLLYPLSGGEMLFLYGPSLQQKSRFVVTYGKERAILAIIDKRLSERAAA